MFHIDPLFEVQIFANKSGALRLNYARLDKDSITPTDDDFGCLVDWVGKFETWIGDERKRGKITEAEEKRILELNESWKQNRDPVANAAVKQELSDWLFRLCQKKA